MVQLNGPISQEWRESLKGVVKKVQMLVRDRNYMSWNFTTVVWKKHAVDEVLWRIGGVGKDTSDEVV